MEEDQGGFAELFRAEYPGIVGELTVFMGDRDAAVDVVQEAFVRLWGRWARISTYDRPGAWVRRVAIRLASRRLRRERLGRRILQRLRPAGAVDSPGDVDVLRAVRDLPERQRTAVVLHYFRGFPVSEVAGVMGCADGTARVHLHRARERLREVLDEEGADDVHR